MAWVKERVTDDGDKRFVARYRDPEGRQRSANREEAEVREGAWHDHSRGQVTFGESASGRAWRLLLSGGVSD